MRRCKGLVCAFVAVAGLALAATRAAAQAPSAGPTPAAEHASPGPPGPRSNEVNGASATTERGFGIFQQKCTTCHGNPAYDRAPSPAALREMTPEHIYDVLTNGVMYPVIGRTLSEADRKLVSEMIAGHLMGAGQAASAAAMPNRCPANPQLTDPASGPVWNGWGVNVRNTRYQPDPGPGLDARTVSKLKLKWAFGLPGGSSVYSQPIVVSGHLFLGSDTGAVYAIDAHTGCVFWSFQAKSGVRNALSVGPVKGQAGVRYGLFFGDLKANVYALDADTGRQLWTRHVEENYTDRVTSSPALYEGKLYVPISSFEEFATRDPGLSCCTSVGEVVAMDASSGDVLWNSYVIPKRPQPTHKNSRGVQQYAPAGGSVWNTPAVDPMRHAIYFGTGDATTFPAAPESDAVMAFDMASGKTLWSYQAQGDDSYLVGCAGAGRTENCPQVQGPDWDIPASVILTKAPTGRRLVIAATKPGDVLALDPDRKGALVWRMNVSGPLAVSAPAVPGAGSPYSGMMWGGAADGENVYFGLTHGGMAAIRIADGKEVWRTPLNSSPANVVSHASPATEIPGVVFIGGMDGSVFALSSKTGQQLWRYDTMREFPTVNAVRAKGGSISSQGVTVADDMVYIGSGYTVTRGQPGNVLLAFGVD